MATASAPILQSPARPYASPWGKSHAAPLAAPQADGALGAVKSAAMDTFHSYQAMPAFLYPVISGTAAERAIILRTLDGLPLKDVSSIASIRMVDSIGTPSGMNGMFLGVTMPATGDMQLSRLGNSLRQIQGFAGPTGHWEPTGQINPQVLSGTLTHEMGHGHDFQGGILRALLHGEESAGGPWGKGPYVSEYAKKNADEDFAETYFHYHANHEQLVAQPGPHTNQDLKTFAPEKWQAMKDSERLNIAERLVDQKPFRETGRMVGELSSALPVVRTGLVLAAAFSAFSLITEGGYAVVDSFGREDSRGAVRGALELGAGLGLGLTYASPLLGPAALALLGARAGLDRADREAAAPNSTHATAGVSFAAATGGALGGAIGGVAGPLGGVWLGYQVAGPIGGVVGMVVGSVLGFRGGSALGAKAGIAIAK